MLQFKIQIQASEQNNAGITFTFFPLCSAFLCIITCRGNADFVKAHEDDILRAPIVCLDANLSDEAIEHVCYLCWR